MTGVQTCALPIWIVLVDDLVTTGATLAEGARALAEAGGDVLAAAVVAATVRRDGVTVSRADPVGRPG